LERNTIRWPRKAKNGRVKESKNKQNGKNGKEKIIKKKNK